MAAASKTSTTAPTTTTETKFVPDKHNPSICIPRVFPNITWREVKNIIEAMGLGKVQRVDMVNKTNDAGKKFKRVFVHFKFWEKNDAAQQVKERLLNNEPVKIVYDDPWFWKVFVSTSPKPTFDKEKGAAVQRNGPRQKKHQRAPPRLVLEEATETNLTPAATETTSTETATTQTDE